MNINLFQKEEIIENDIPPELPEITSNMCNNNIYQCSVDERQDYCLLYYDYDTKTRAACHGYCMDPRIIVSNDNCYSQMLCAELNHTYPEFNVDYDGFDACEVCIPYNIKNCPNEDIETIISDLKYIKPKTFITNYNVLESQIIIDIDYNYKLNNELLQQYSVDSMVLEANFKESNIDYTFIININTSRGVEDDNYDLNGIRSIGKIPMQNANMIKYGFSRGVFKIDAFIDTTVLLPLGLYKLTVFEYNNPSYIIDFDAYMIKCNVTRERYGPKMYTRAYLTFYGVDERNRYYDGNNYFTFTFIKPFGN